MNELLVSSNGWKNSPFFVTTAVVFLGILIGMALIKLPLSYFLVFMVLVISPYLFIKPHKTFLFFLSLLILFPNVDYAIREGSKVIDIYGKGVGILPLPLIDFLLFFLFGAALCGLVYERRNTNRRFLLLDYSILVFLITSIIYIIVSFLTNPIGISMEGFRNAVYRFGVIGIVEFCLVYFVVYIIFSKKKQLIELTNFIFFLALARASYGIIRFIFFGGDPREYASRMGFNLKFTFFEIGDVAFFMFILSFCFLNIFIILRKKKIFYITIFIILFNILFSFRRVAWAGSILVLIYLFQKISKRKRILFYVAALILLIPALISLISMRFGSLENSIGDISFDYSSSNKMGRFGELYYAIKTISKSPIFGQGVTGIYIASPSFNWPAPPDMVHSTILHIALKMGLIGLIILFFVILGVYLLNVNSRKINLPDKELKVIFYSAYSTLILLVFNFLFANPLAVFRHAAGYGLFVGLVRVSYKFLIQNHEISSAK